MKLTIHIHSAPWEQPHTSDSEQTVLDLTGDFCTRNVRDQSTFRNGYAIGISEWNETLLTDPKGLIIIVAGIDPTFMQKSGTVNTVFLP